MGDLWLSAGALPVWTLAGVRDYRHLRRWSALDRRAKESHRGSGHEGSGDLPDSTDRSEGRNSKSNRQDDLVLCRPNSLHDRGESWLIATRFWAFLPPPRSLKRIEEARMQMPFGRHKGQEI